MIDETTFTPIFNLRGNAAFAQHGTVDDLIYHVNHNASDFN